MNHLTEEDVPGAKLPHPNPNLNKVEDLKRWLTCRGISNNANKPELIKRVTECIANQQHNRIVPSIDKSIWFYKKFPYSQNQQIPTSGWKSFPSIMIPKSFSYDKIMGYIDLIGNIEERRDSSSDEDNEYQPTTKNSKSLRRARICFTSGHITNMHDNDDGQHYYLKSEVQASYSGVIYKVSVMLNKTDAKIIEGSCQCKASTSRCCSHIIGTLFALEDYTIHFGYQIISCTSIINKWNQGRKKGNNPMKITEAKYDHFKKKMVNRKRFLEFNPVKQRGNPESQVQTTNKFVSDLQRFLPNCMFLSLLKFKYEDYTLSAAFKEILLDKIQQMKTSLNIQAAFGPALLIASQNNSAWQNARRVRITASVAKSYFTATKYENLIKDHLWSNIDISQLSAVAYGNENEPRAFLEYKNFTGTDVRKTGFYCNARYAGMGCSPDGVTYDAYGNVISMLEIKCPKRLEHISPFEYQKARNPNTLCFTTDEFGNLNLKRNHCYYFQIQFSLAIMELKVCDFMIWSSAGFLIERIERNDVLISYLMPKLMVIHEKILLVEFFEMRLPRELPLIIF